MPELVGKLLVKDSRIYVFNGNHEIPLLTWMVSFGVRVGDKLKVNVEKVNEDDQRN